MSDIRSPKLLPRIDRLPVVQLVIDRLLTLVREGHVAPGERLPTEQELMRRLGVSRSSVREGLRALAALGLIETRPGQGSFVSDVDLDKVINEELLRVALAHVELRVVMEARMLLEPEIARLASLNATDDDLKALEEVLSEYKRAVQTGEPVFEAAWQFHELLAEAAGNSVMAKFMRVVYVILKEIEAPIYETHFDKKRELLAHAALLEAIGSGDPEYGKRSMVDHLRQTEDIVMGALHQE
jgi:GntR family transcriptional repressor for pyruvate dehydrogenase complex